MAKQMRCALVSSCCSGKHNETHQLIYLLYDKTNPTFAAVEIGVYQVIQAMFTVTGDHSK